MPGEYIFLLLAIAFLAYTMFKKIKFGWHIRWSQGVPKKPTKQGEGYYVDFPKQGTGGHLNDILFHVPWWKRAFLKGVKSITIRGNITGDGFVIMENFDPVTHPATVTLLLQRRGDKRVDFEEKPEYLDYRWYSREMIPLAAGEFEVTFPLNAQEMGGVNGSHNPKTFEEAFKDLLGWGVVFGSAGGRAHGVCVREAGRFTLTSFTYNR